MSASPAPLVAPAAPAAPPVAVDVYAETLKNLQRSLRLLAGWRRLFAHNAPGVAQQIAATLAQLAAAGEAPAIDAKEIAEALHKRASVVFQPQILNDFAGYTTGPGPTGAVVFKAWDPVIEQGNWHLQKATQSNTAFVRPADIQGTDADYQLNAYSRESGLIAFHTGTYGPGPKQNLLFNFYPLGPGRILWLGQTVDDQLQPNAGTTYTVAVNYKSGSGGQRAFLLVLLELTLDPKGNIAMIGGPPPATFVADAPPFLQLVKRIVYFKNSLLAEWRTKFRDANDKLGDSIAAAFDAERKNAAHDTFPAPPLSGEELRAAFVETGQRYIFNLDDLNQFAGKWNATTYSFSSGSAQPLVFPQYLTWLDFTLAEDGYFQRVVGSGVVVDDPLLIYGDEAGLQNLVLDAWLPECGLSSWLSGYGPDPQTAESAVIAYKLAADRTLWVAQFFSKQAVEGAMANNKPLPDSNSFNLTLEWILPDGPDRKRRYLVSMFFTIDFPAGTATLIPTQPIVKVKSFAA